MITRLYTSLLAVLFLLQTTLSLTLPTNTTTPTLTAAIKSGINCIPATVFGSRLANTRDCLRAANLLPDGADPSIFHSTNNPNDDTRLPLRRLHESCQVTVSLSGGEGDRSSWDHIIFSASQIITVCSLGQYPLGQTGGTMYVGKGGHIRIGVEKKAQVSVGEGEGDGGTATA